MPKKVGRETEAAVKQLFKAGMSSRKIQKHLEKSGVHINQSTIIRIINDNGKRREAKALGLSSPKKYQPLKVRNSALRRKIDLMTKQENPPSQRQMARRLNVSARTVRRIIHEDLKKKTTRKRQVHSLQPRHIQNRKTNSRKLYERHLAGHRSQYAVTLDEALFWVQDCNGTRKICYTTSREEVEKFVCPKKERFGDKMMVVGAVSGRGVLPLKRVPPKVKINSKYYVNDVLKPLLEKEVPKLYPGECDKVFVHHDAASSHTAKFTASYAAQLKEDLGITIISNSLIPVKSPDTSPMDFFGFGFLKQRLAARRAKTLDGVWKVLRDEWSKITPQKVEQVFSSWKRRLRCVSRRGGQHIEQTKAIHRRKL